MRSRVILASAFMAAILVAACGGPKDGGGLRPDANQFSSEWLEVSMGGMMAVPGEGPSLSLSLKNTSRKPIWVQVEFSTPDAAQDCTVDKRLEVGGGGMFLCAQQGLIQDQDYPIFVRTYSDAQHKQLLESTQTHFRFGAKDVAAFNRLVQSTRSAQK